LVIIILLVKKNKYSKIGNEFTESWMRYFGENENINENEEGSYLLSLVIPYIKHFIEKKKLSNADFLENPKVDSKTINKLIDLLGIERIKTNL